MKQAWVLAFLAALPAAAQEQEGEKRIERLIQSLDDDSKESRENGLRLAASAIRRTTINAITAMMAATTTHCTKRNVRLITIIILCRTTQAYFRTTRVLQPFAKYCSADSHHSRALFNRNFKVVRHSHRELT